MAGWPELTTERTGPPQFPFAIFETRPDTTLSFAFLLTNDPSISISHRSSPPGTKQAANRNRNPTSKRLPSANVQLQLPNLHQAKKQPPLLPETAEKNSTAKSERSQSKLSHSLSRSKKEKETKRRLLYAMATTPTPTNLRALYRRLLRELPSLPSKPTRTPLQTHIRETFTLPSSPSPSSSASASASAAPPKSSFTAAALSDPHSASSAFTKDTSSFKDTSRLEEGEAAKTPQEKVQEAEQLVLYLKAQRMYVTLVERYNPGMAMSEEEKVRLTARRVGMDLPVEHPRE